MVIMNAKAHWEKVYTTKAVTEVSWFQAHDALTLNMIQQAALPLSATILDVGGGASTLVDDLMAKGYTELSVLDISGNALKTAQSRLGQQASQVLWIEANILQADLPAQAYDLWHDRAVFHFLIHAADRCNYVHKVRKALKPGGLLIMATFAADGPVQCSGLPVMRYSASALQAELGDSFVLIKATQHLHRTPGGNAQKFIYCQFRMDNP